MNDLYNEDIITLAGGSNDFEYDHEVFERAAEWIYAQGKFTPEMLGEKPAVDVINETYRILGGAVGSSISQQVPDELIEALQNNAFVFSGFKTFHTLNEVGLSLVDDRGGIKPFETFRKDVKKIDSKYNKNYLYAEYNHAVTSSQMAAKWHDFEQDGDRYDLQYRTAGDERVRAEHQSLHNITLPLDDPFWSQFTPPNGWNCRCTVVQVRKDKYLTSDSAKCVEIGEEITNDPKKRMFRFNPGKELKIYPDKHPYYKAPKEVETAIAESAKEENKTERRIKDMVAEMPNNLTDTEKRAIAEHNLILEKVLNIKKGKPMTVEDADKQSANPNYSKEYGYTVNCQTCAPAYALRLLGFDITAKAKTAGSLSEYLARQRSFEAWQNIDKTPAIPTLTLEWMMGKGYKMMTAKRYNEFFEETCKDEGVYILTIGWKGGGGHATVLQRFNDGKLSYIEPQLYDEAIGTKRGIDELCTCGATKPIATRGVLRVDNKLFDTKFVSIFDK